MRNTKICTALQHLSAAEKLFILLYCTAALLGSEIFRICTEFALVIKVWKQTIVFWDLFPGFLKIDERNNCFDVGELELLSSFPKRTSFERNYLRVVSQTSRQGIIKYSHLESISMKLDTTLDWTSKFFS